MSVDLVAPGARLVEASTGALITGAELTSRIGAVAGAVSELPPGVIFTRAGLNIESTLRYLGCWAAGRPVAVLDPGLDPGTLITLTQRFKPTALLGLQEQAADMPGAEAPLGYVIEVKGPLGPCLVREDGPAAVAHPDLGLLLATSGSTGDPRLVRLSRHAVLANALSIAEALSLNEDEVAPTSLPLFYSYGMSVLNSHLVAGASVLVADGGILSGPFWEAFDTHGATSLAGVPYNYELLHRIRWRPSKHATLRTLTQAGGRLRTELIEAFHGMMKAQGGTFRPMYGQTEATARMAVMPTDRLEEKMGSPGCALPGGALSIRTADGSDTQEAGVEGEVVYRGPNVMMGYADSADDLVRGDDLEGVLRTGDVGFLDGEGFLFITGRIKRIGKVFGVRVNLDDIERIVAKLIDRGQTAVAAVSAGDKVAVWHEGPPNDDRRNEITRLLSTRLKMHRSGFVVRSIDQLPLLSNGKVDYRKLEAML